MKKQLPLFVPPARHAIDASSPPPAAPADVQRLQKPRSFGFTDPGESEVSTMNGDVLSRKRLPQFIRSIADTGC